MHSSLGRWGRCGALGAYQAGVFESLAAMRHTPDWVAGISIGAINAALIAGGLPAISAALIAPIEMPATQSGVWRIAASDSKTPAWYAPSAPQRPHRPSEECILVLQGGGPAWTRRP